MALYNLPIGIRIPRDDEYPEGYDANSINDKRNTAKIIEGFAIKEVSGEKFSHYFEVNINANKIWDVFCSLSNEVLDDVAYGIIGFKDEKSTLSRFVKTEKLIDIFAEFKFELINDGYLEFGTAHYDDNSLNEIFVSSFKYLKIWTKKKDLIISILSNFGIRNIESLQFIDEFPVVSEALNSDIHKGARHYSDVIEQISQRFEEL